MWKEFFFEQLPIDLQASRCPVLIGVMKSLTMGTELLWKYVPEVLLIDGVLPRTNEGLGLECLLWNLIVFKQDFDENHRYPVNLCFVGLCSSILRLILVVRFRSKHRF